MVDKKANSLKKAKVSKPKPSVLIRLVRALRRRPYRKERAEEEHRRNERAMADWAQRVGWFTFLLALCAIANVAVIILQLKEMHSGGVDNHLLAERELRAYVTVKSIGLKSSNSQLSVFADLVNTGRSPARIVAYQINYEFPRITDGQFTLSVERPVTGSIYPAQDIGGQQVIPTAFSPVVPISLEEAARGIVFFCRLKVSYSDVFDHRWSTVTVAKFEARPTIQNQVLVISPDQARGDIIAERDVPAEQIKQHP